MAFPAFGQAILGDGQSNVLKQANYPPLTNTNTAEKSNQNIHNLSMEPNVLPSEDSPVIDKYVNVLKACNHIQT